jgi:hypothetical protein
MIPKDDTSSDSKGEPPKMKKLLLAALGLGIALGSISFAAQDQTTDKTTTTKTKKHKKNKKSSDTTNTNKM